MEISGQLHAPAALLPEYFILSYLTTVFQSQTL